MTSNYSKFLSEDEKVNKEIMRRHPFAKKNIKKGEIIDYRNIKFLRPKFPSKPVNLNLFLGKKINRNIDKNSLVKLEYLT